MTLGWVKSHINGKADAQARRGAMKGKQILKATEGGVRQKNKEWRTEWCDVRTS